MVINITNTVVDISIDDKVISISITMLMISIAIPIPLTSSHMLIAKPNMSQVT
jgi:hypothetical protein